MGGDAPMPIVSVSMSLRARDAAFLSLMLRRGLREARAEGWQFTPGQRQLIGQVETLAGAHREEARRFAAELDVTAVTAAGVTGSNMVGMNTAAAAARLGIGEPGVRKMIRTGRLPACKVRGSWSIEVEDLNDEADRRRAS